MEPEEIESRQFGTTLRGYDRSEVDEFAKEVAEQLRWLQGEIAEMQAALEAAKAAPPPPPAAPAPPDHAPSRPARTDAYKQLGEDTARILISAEQAGHKIKDQAKLEAAEILADARREAGRIARKTREEKQQAEADVRQILSTRALLADQLEDVRRRLAEAVARLQAPMELTAPPQGQSGPPDVLPSLEETKPAEAHAGTGPQPAESRATVSASGEKRSGAEKVEVEEERAAPEVAAASSSGAGSRAVANPGAPPAQPEAGPLGKETPPRTQSSSTRPETGERSQAVPAQREVTAAPLNGNGRKADRPRDIVEELLDEIREEEAPSRPAEAVSAQPQGLSPSPPPAPSPQKESPSPEMFETRSAALGDSVFEAARKLKRLLQEDHNDLLHRLRTQRGRGTPDENMASEGEQLERFQRALELVLQSAFEKGRKAAGAGGQVDPGTSLSSLVAKQVVLPLRSDLHRVVENGLTAQDTPTAISERASDVFRIWKGVRTELLGEGLVLAAFHQGQISAWKTDRRAGKRWVLSPDEEDCPKGVCLANAEQGPLPVGSKFSSGHLTPPAHGGCTCALESS